MIKNVVCTIRVSNEDERICDVLCAGYSMNSIYCGIFETNCVRKDEQYRCSECIKSEVKDG